MTTDLLLSQAIEGFFIARRADGYSPKTLYQYDWALKMLLEMGDLPIKQIDTEYLRRFMASVQQKPSLSSSSVFHIWKALRAFYKWLSSEGLAARPDKALTKPRFAYQEVHPFTQDEIKALLKAVDKTRPTEGRRASFQMRRPTKERDKAIVLLLLDTGIRAGELCRLTGSDVDLQNGLITIRPYRSSVKSHPRVIPFGQVVRKALWKYSTSHPFIPNKLIFDLELPSSLLHLLRNLGNRAGIKKVHPHRFRHTFAIEYLRNGGDIFTLQRILGHSSLDMVRRYLNIAQADVQSAHRRAAPVDRWLDYKSTRM